MPSWFGAPAWGCAHDFWPLVSPLGNGTMLHEYMGCTFPTMPSSFTCCPLSSRTAPITTADGCRPLTRGPSWEDGALSRFRRAAVLVSVFPGRSRSPPAAAGLLSFELRPLPLLLPPLGPVPPARATADASSVTAHSATIARKTAPRMIELSIPLPAVCGVRCHTGAPSFLPSCSCGAPGLAARRVRVGQVLTADPVALKLHCSSQAQKSSPRSGLALDTLFWGRGPRTRRSFGCCIGLEIRHSFVDSSVARGPGPLTDCWRVWAVECSATLLEADGVG